MVNIEYSYEYYDSHPEMKGIHRLEKISSILGEMNKYIKAGVFALLCVPTPAGAQDTAGKDCFIETSQGEREITECIVEPPVSGVIIQKPFIKLQDYDSDFYAGIIQDAFYEDGGADLPENFSEISEKFIYPLHQVLIDVGVGNIFTGDDAANITSLAMLIGQEGFEEQYDYVKSSFPRDDVNTLFQEKLQKIFNPSSNI